ncbi:unnamed protein product [Rhodiola kirilowii]
MSDKSFNKYLHITKAILPRDNNYPSSYKDVKILLKNMGLDYETIHACEYGCILYYKENKDLLSCLVCGEARYAKRGSKSRVPKKTVKYFPLTPRLQRLYMSPHTYQPKCFGTLKERSMTPSTLGTLQMGNHGKHLMKSFHSYGASDDSST